MHSFILSSFVRSFVRSSIHPYLRPFIRSFVRSFVRSLVRSFARSLVRSFARSVGRSVGQSVSQSVTHSVTQSVSHLSHPFLSDSFNELSTQLFIVLVTNSTCRFFFGFKKRLLTVKTFLFFSNKRALYFFLVQQCAPLQ